MPEIVPVRANVLPEATSTEPEVPAKKILLDKVISAVDTNFEDFKVISARLRLLAAEIANSPALTFVVPV